MSALEATTCNLASRRATAQADHAFLPGGKGKELTEARGHTAPLDSGRLPVSPLLPAPLGAADTRREEQRLFPDANATHGGRVLSYRWYHSAMSKVESLEREVEKLTPQELTAFREWFAGYDADAWDRQIERDAAAGKLDKLAAEALAAHDRGETKGM